MTRLLKAGFVLVALAAPVAAAADVRSTPDERAGVLLLALLVAWAAGSLVAGQRRRRT
ncbi:hypothetical protein [Dactylosporangium sp. NPDC000521]|uniref:hypothetical protein n=1 Tax=Dactylosporangium sp. NPDC000521 TaxID=3363975 RepID=UPI00368E9D70